MLPTNYLLSNQIYIYAGILCVLAEWYDTKSNVKLGRFQSQLQVSYMSSHTDKMKQSVSEWQYIYIYNHHVVPLAWISLTLSRHFFLSFIASGRSSELHPVSSHNCCMYVWAGCPAFVRPYVGVYRSTSLMSLSLLLQQCPACLVRLTWIVFVMGGRWPFSWCLVGCCRQDLFNIVRNILVWLLSCFFCSHLVSI